MINHSFTTRLTMALGVLSLLAIFSCTDPITVGSDLLSDDRASIGYNGNLEIDLRTIADDSLRVYIEENNQSTNYALFGTIEDPVFGKSNADIYLIPTLPRSSTSGLILVPSFAGTGSDTINIDSVVIVLPIDTLISYGDVFNNSFAYTVKELSEFVDINQDIFSNAQFALQETAIASGEFTPSIEPSFLHDTTILDSILVRQVRIKLDQSVANKFLAEMDGSIYSSDSEFQAFFNGLFVESTTTSNSLLAINADENPRTSPLGLYFYTSQNNTNHSVFRIPFEVAVPNYTFDYTNSLAETLLDEQVSTNQQGLVQSLGGLTARIEITNLDDFTNRVINNAELDVFLKDLTDYNYDAYPAAGEIALYFRTSAGLYSRIFDAQTLVPNASVANRLFFLGGNLRTDETTNRQFYRTTLSAHLQEIIRGDAEPFIYLRVNPLDSDGGRSIIYGPESTEFPMRLKVAFTEF